MADLTIYLGNKNYSSWSLRPWLVLKRTTVDFDEVVIPLYQPGSRETILKYSPSGRVPALHHGAITVWESLAICEYLAESFPNFELWPKDPAARALVRAASAEMHAGFGALRAHLPMNIRSSFPGRGVTPEVQADINRIMSLWRDCRARFGEGQGEFLFGNFGIADAMFAPVVTRFRTYIGANRTGRLSRSPARADGGDRRQLDGANPRFIVTSLKRTRNALDAAPSTRTQVLPAAPAPTSVSLKMFPPKLGVCGHSPNAIRLLAGAAAD